MALECQSGIEFLSLPWTAWGIMRPGMHWDYIVILAFLGLIVPWRGLSRLKIMLHSEVTGRDRVVLYASTIAFQWAISAIIAWRCFVGGLDRQDLGLETVHWLREVVAVLLVSTLLVTNQIIGVRHLASKPVEKRGLIGRLAEKLLPRVRREKELAILLVFTVAICEEFIYRGFVEGWFHGLTDSAAAGALMSAAFFASAHVYQGRRGILMTFLVGLVLSGVRIWTGSLLPCISIHFAVDLSAGMASYRLLARPEAQLYEENAV